MIIKKWNYTNEIVRSIDYDVFYCDILRRMVDLGWDEYVSMVHTWVTVLNKINSKLHKNGITTNLIEMNNNTFDLLELAYNEYYKDNKLGSYSIKINDTIKNNRIHLISNNAIVGKILIKGETKEKQL